MKKVMGWILGIVAAVGLIGGGFFMYNVEKGKKSRYQTLNYNETRTFEYATDSTTLERGAYLYQNRGCAECHGKDGSGGFMINEGDFIVRGSNLTRGEGGASATYAPTDWINVLRHGVKKDGKPLLAMPAEDYFRMSEQDLVAIVSHIQTLPAVDKVTPEHSIPPFIYFLVGMGEIPYGFQRIDHSYQPPVSVAVEDTAQYGGYLINTCKGCHGDNLAGQVIPGAPPGTPRSANLTLSGESPLRKYSEDDFVKFFKTGTTVDGRKPGFMPMAAFQTTDELELRAMYKHLQTVPAVEVTAH